jgi:hypothetical protein
MDLEVKSSFTRLLLGVQPLFKLFGGMSGSIIKDKGHRLHLTTQRFGNDLLLHKGLEIGKTLALPTHAVDLPISDGESSKQMTCPATMVACLVPHRLTGKCGTGRLFAFTGLDGSFFIQTDQPNALLQKRSRLTIGLEYRTSPVQELMGIMDMLPRMIAPRAKTFGIEPTTNRTC